MVEQTESKKIVIGNDSFELSKSPVEDSALRYVFKVIVCPRCDHYKVWCRHEVNITFFALDGDLMIEVNDSVHLVKSGTYLDVSRGSFYRVRSMERQPVHVLAYADDENVVESWTEVALQVRANAVRGRDGVLRYS